MFDQQTNSSKSSEIKQASIYMVVFPVTYNK